MSAFLVTCFFMPGEIEGLRVTSSVDLCNEFELCPMIPLEAVSHLP